MRKYKYWAGHLIGGHDEHTTIAKTLPPPPPLSMLPPSSMPVSDMNFWGVLTNDIKVVEWYVARLKACGIAAYFDEERDGFCHPREDDADAVAIHGERFADGWGTGFSRWLYDPVDEDLAYRELAYRNKERADLLVRVEAKRLAEGRDESGRSPANYEAAKKHRRAHEGP
jgi:hypothetical protein